MSKKKIATIWLAGCSGCHMSLLDIDERILDVAKLADIVKSPVVDGKDLPDVDVTLVEGAVGTDEHLEEIKQIRKKSKIVVSFGDCALTANVPSMRNTYPTEQVLNRAYIEAETNVNEQKIIPHEEIGRLTKKALPLHEVIKVDYVIPGCPPSADLIFYVLFELLNGREPVYDKGNIRYG